MKKHHICYLISGILALAFIVKTAIDYGVYTTTLNSAPFYVWILINGLYFLVPALIPLVIGLVWQRKSA